MFLKPGHHIGDAWFFVHADRVHLFYLTCSHDIPRHTRWSIGHAVSENLTEWKDCGVILEPGEPGSWDGICPATGSVTQFQGRYYMAYTGNFAGPNPSVGMAVSDDLYRWSKQMDNPVTAIDAKHYSDAPNLAWGQQRWRDPFLCMENGKVYQLVTAGKIAAEADGSGTIAVVVSDDMKSWSYLPPLDLPEMAQDLECPKLHKIGGKYYLTVSVSDPIMGQALRSRQPHGLPLATSYCLVADRFGGPYALHGTGRILEDDSWGTPYACEPVLFRGRFFLLGTVWSEDGNDFICDPIPVEATAKGFKAERRV